MIIWFSGIYNSNIHDEAREISDRFARNLARRIAHTVFLTKLRYILFFPSILDRGEHGAFGSNRRMYRRKLLELHIVERIDYEDWRFATYPVRIDLLARCLSDAITDTKEALLPPADKTQLLAAIEASRVELRDQSMRQ